MPDKASILIVDDEIGSRESLRLVLEPHYKVHSVADGREAIRLIKNENIDLVTLELRIPGLSGIEVLKEIRKVKADMEVIIISRYLTLGNMREASSYGAAAFVHKPFQVTEVLEIVSESMAERRYKQKIKRIIQQIKDGYYKRQ